MGWGLQGSPASCHITDDHIKYLVKQQVLMQALYPHAMPMSPSHQSLVPLPDALVAPQALESRYSGLEQALLLAWCTHVQKGTSRDELQAWQMAPYVEAVMAQPRSYFMLQVGRWIMGIVEVWRSGWCSSDTGYCHRQGIEGQLDVHVHA